MQYYTMLNLNKIYSGIKLIVESEKEETRSFRKKHNLSIIKEKGWENILRENGDYLVLWHGTGGKNLKKLQRSDYLNPGMYLAVEKEEADKWARVNNTGKLATIYFYIPIKSGILEPNGFFSTQEKIELEHRGGQIGHLMENILNERESDVLDASEAKNVYEEIYSFLSQLYKKYKTDGYDRVYDIIRRNYGVVRQEHYPQILLSINGYYSDSLYLKSTDRKFLIIFTPNNKGGASYNGSNQIQLNYPANKFKEVMENLPYNFAIKEDSFIHEYDHLIVDSRMTKSMTSRDFKYHKADKNRTKYINQTVELNAQFKTAINQIMDEILPSFENLKKWYSVDDQLDPEKMIKDIHELKSAQAFISDILYKMNLIRRKMFGKTPEDNTFNLTPKQIKYITKRSYTFYNNLLDKLIKQLNA